MKRTLLLAGAIGLSLGTAFAADAPRGMLLELHSCELYAGGCTVSSEATLGGRYMLRVWKFSGGAFNGTDLAGLQLAVLQSSPDNLAMPDSRSGEAVVYLPQAATAGQRAALLGWLKSSQADFRPAKIHIRCVPLEFVKTEQGYAFSAGKFVSGEMSAMERCETFTCGEALWYQPRASTSLFTVGVNRSSRVAEPWLDLKWDDAARRSIFVGRFGEPDSARNLYVSLGEVCGAL